MILLKNLVGQINALFLIITKHPNLFFLIEDIFTVIQVICS